MDSLILAKKTYGARRLRLEKKEKLTTIFMWRLLKRIWEKERETDDGRAKFMPLIKFVVDMEKLPKEYKGHKRASIHKALLAWENILWVTKWETYWSVRVY
jgi:hypothetical protein